MSKENTIHRGWPPASHPYQRGKLRKFLFSCLNVLFLVIGIVSHQVAIGQTFHEDGSVSAGSTEFTLSATINLTLPEALALEANFRATDDWGLKGTLQSGGYIHLQLSTHIDRDYILGHIAHAGSDKPNDKVYSHKPFYYLYPDGTTQKQSIPAGPYTQVLLDRTLSMVELDPSQIPNATPLWTSNELRSGLFRAYFEQANTTGIDGVGSGEIPVTLTLTMKLSTLELLDLPGVNLNIPLAVFGNTNKGVQVTVLRSNGNEDHYLFTEEQASMATVNTDTKLAFGAAHKVPLTAGDKVTYIVLGAQNQITNPKIQGVPKVFAGGFAAQREFITTPDYGPNQYEPWVGFEAQTHFRMINSYPESFKPYIKTGDWEQETPKSKSWTWYAQRRSDANKTIYKPNVYYPKTRGFFNSQGTVTGYQRESQSTGWAKQFLELYRKYGEGPNSIPEYTTGFDIDEFLYAGSKEDSAYASGSGHGDKTYEAWFAAASAKHGANNVGIITTTNFVDDFNSGLTNQNWQQMWASEEKASLNIQAGDFVVDDGMDHYTYQVAHKNYPLVWDKDRGFPKAGFLYNDMITAYQKYKDADLPADYYYNGYEIEDTHTFYVGDSPSTGTWLTRDTNTDKPVPCQDDCWYLGNESTGNNKHPGVVSVTLDDGFVIEFRQEVVSPQSQDHGFYGSFNADQYPMGFGNTNSFELKGVANGDEGFYSISMLTYDAGNGKFLVDSTLDVYSGATYDASAQTLTANFNIFSGWVAIAAYYKTADGLDSVIVAGRVPMIMDPPNSLTIPGSNPFPYAPTSLVPEGGIDLKEGQGDRSYETMNEIRAAEDPGEGFSMPYGEGFADPYVREYVLNVGDKVTFSSIGAGRKIESFWKNNSKDPYQSWRNEAKRMPSSVAGQRMHWEVVKLDEFGNGTSVQTSTIRHFTYQFNELGEFEVQVRFNGDTEHPTKVNVKVKEFDSRISNVSQLDQKFNRASIEYRPLTVEERQWLAPHNSTINLNLDKLRVAEITQANSLYEYNVGPRSSHKNHREGRANDFNARYSWELVHGFNEITPYSDAYKPVQLTNAFIDNFDPSSVWPEAWGDVWLYHLPGSFSDPLSAASQTLDRTKVKEDAKPSDADAFQNIMSWLYEDATLSTNQDILGWLRWYPWIGISPSDGYKFNRYIKTSVDLHDFFNNHDVRGSGGKPGDIFSGEPRVAVQNVSNAVTSNDWLDYGSPDSRPTEAELERHMPDVEKNKLEFYYDLLYKHKVLVDVSDQNILDLDPNLVAYNLNPKRNSADESKPDQIYMSGAPYPNQNDFADEHSNPVGIPLLTFDDARSDRTLLNSKYNFIDHTPATYQTEVEHLGFNRFLKVDLTGFDHTSAGLDLDINIPTALTNSPSGPAHNVNVYGFSFNLGISSASMGTGTQFTFIIRAFDVSGTELELYYLGVTGGLIRLTNGEYTLFEGTGKPDRDIELYFNGGQTKELGKIRLSLFQVNNPSASAKPTYFVDGMTLLNKPYDQPQVTYTPPTESTPLHDWLKTSVYRFFDWNYVEIDTDKGAFKESAVEEDKLSLSGQGMGIAVTILAAENGYLTSALAEERVRRVLKFFHEIGGVDMVNYRNGTKGWKGMPSHFYDTHGDLFPKNADWPNGQMAISTIDWAIFAQGIRLARQYYPDNADIVNYANDLLTMTEWSDFVMPARHADGMANDNAGRLAFDLNQRTGALNSRGNAWGQAFSEETDLVYLEALASLSEQSSGTSLDLSRIHREWKEGYFPSFFGAGFTYNWLQLWVGSHRLNADGTISQLSTRYKDNSIEAYKKDYDDALTAFDKHYMGLTVGSTVSSLKENGYVEYNRYVSNQGSTGHIAREEEVIREAPGPYGAVMALPFRPTEVNTALGAYTDLGFFHEYMGLPDIVAMKRIGDKKPLPNWGQLDINQAPIAMAIDQINNRVVSTNLLKDTDIQLAYKALYQSLDANWGVKQQFAIIADYGCDRGFNESYHTSTNATYNLNGKTIVSGTSKVANWVSSLQPDFVVSLGNDNYQNALPDGRGECATTFEDNVQQYYGDWISQDTQDKPNAFYPTPGNHDYENTSHQNTFEALHDNWSQYFPTDQLVNFGLKGPEHRYYESIREVPISGIHRNDDPAYGGRFYTYKQGDIRFFVISTMYDVQGSGANGVLEPYGIEYSASYDPATAPTGDHSRYAQAFWLKKALERSHNEGDKFQVVTSHFNGISSFANPHDLKMKLQSWPLANWGVDVVLAADASWFEHWQWNGVDYITNGTGGDPGLDFNDATLTPDYAPNDHPQGATKMRGIYGRYGGIQAREFDDRLDLIYTAFSFDSGTDTYNGPSGNYDISDTYQVDSKYTIQIYPRPFIGDGVAARVAQQTEETPQLPHSGSVVVYPNESEGVFNAQIEISPDATGLYEGALFDVQGRIIGTYEWDLLDAGTYTLTVGSPNLAEGTYFLGIRGNKDQWVERLLVKKN